MRLNSLCFVVMLSFSLLLSYKVLASYEDFVATQDTHQISDTYDENVICYYTQDLLEMEIGKINISNTPEDPAFEFYVKMSQLQAEPGELIYRWVVEPPEGSLVSTQPMSSYRLNLRPDIWGTYHITLAMQDASGHCQYTVYVFQYPEMGEEDSRPSIHAQSPWQTIDTF